ncbi:hypothetical protein BKA81DRAFT_406656 [Phyllosticta paracitricarpa]
MSLGQGNASNHVWIPREEGELPRGPGNDPLVGEYGVPPEPLEPLPAARDQAHFQQEVEILRREMDNLRRHNYSLHKTNRELTTELDSYRSAGVIPLAQPHLPESENDKNYVGVPLRSLGINKEFWKDWVLEERPQMDDLTEVFPHDPAMQSLWKRRSQELGVMAEEFPTINVTGQPHEYDALALELQLLFIASPGDLRKLESTQGQPWELRTNHPAHRNTTKFVALKSLNFRSPIMSPHSQDDACDDHQDLSEQNKKLWERIAELSTANARLAEERDRANSMLRASQSELQVSNARAEERMGMLRKLFKRFHSAMNLVKEKDDTIKLQEDLIETQRDLIRSLEKSEGSVGH